MHIDNFKYNLQRLQQCDQAWDEMLPSVGGRNCEKCARTIADFSAMSVSSIGRQTREIRVSFADSSEIRIGTVLLESYDDGFIEFYVTMKKRSRLGKVWRKLTSWIR